MVSGVGVMCQQGIIAVLAEGRVSITFCLGKEEEEETHSHPPAAGGEPPSERGHTDCIVGSVVRHVLLCSTDVGGNRDVRPVPGFLAN